MDILSRSAGLVGLFLLGHGAAWLIGGDDAVIGIGLAVFAAALAVAAVWGFLDGRRLTFARHTVTWVAVSVVVGVAGVALIVAGDGLDSIDWSAVRSDLAGTAPFLAALVAGPAILAGVLGRGSSGYSASNPMTPSAK